FLEERVVTCWLLLACELTCRVLVCELTRFALVCVALVLGAGVVWLVVCACFFFFFLDWSSVCAACTDARPTNSTVTKVTKRFINVCLLLLRHLAATIYSTPLLPDRFEQNNRHCGRRIQAPRSVHRDRNTILPV